VETALSELGSKAVSSPPVPAPRIAKRQTVGHDKERAQLHGAFQNVMAGRGLMVCVSGEPGKGKTTFVEDFLAEPIVNGQSCAVARGRCSERLAGTEAYSPFLEALGNLLRSNAGPSLERTIKLLAPSWYIQIVPIPLEDSLDVRGPDVKAGSQERMKRELAAFLQEVSRFRPLVLFFDDLQWVDESTIDLLAYLADFVAWATILRASTLDQPGQSEEAITDIRESLATLRAIGSELARPLFLAIMAKEYAKAGRTTDGLSVLNEALEIVNRTEERYCEAEVYRLKGELLVRQGLFHDAETCFHKAIGVAREQGSKSFELRAVTSLARLRQTQAKREEAREMLAEIYNWFTEGLNTADLKEARALLDQLATSF